MLVQQHNIALADSPGLLLMYRWLHARRNQSSVLAEPRTNPDAGLLRRLTVELVARGLL